MRLLLALALLIASSCVCARDADPLPPVITAPQPSPFVVFDGLAYLHKPNLQRLGLIELRGSDHIWRPGVPRDEVDPRGVISIAKFLATFGDAYYLDVELWPVCNVSADAAKANLARLMRVAELARAATPDRRFGFYGLLPQGVYWAFVLKRQDEIDAWRRCNELSAPLASRVDFVLPSLYTFYDDPEGWKTAARAVLTEARRFGKPVYPFIWPEYHNTNKKLAGQSIPRDYWRMQLDLIREYADGVVLWGGYQKKWDDNAPWWLETKDFLKTAR